MLELGAYHGVAFTGLVMLEPDHGPQLPVQVQHHAVLEIIRRRHAYLPSSLCPLIGSRPGYTHPATSQTMLTPGLRLPRPVSASISSTPRPCSTAAVAPTLAISLSN